jgi:hypothetical protein
MASTKKQWKTAQFRLPVAGFSDWRQAKAVRISGEEVQVQVVRNVSLPYSYSTAEYAQEVLAAGEGLVDDTMDFLDATECEGSEILVKGWKPATDAELAVIQGESDSVTWRPLTF